MRLGQTGLEVGRLALGTANFGGRTDAAEALRTLDAALDAGVFFWDTADSYGSSEEILGQALSRPGVRDRVVLATKVGWPMADGRGASRSRVLRHIDASLRRLGTDFIDLYQVHRPDFETPLEETVAAMDRCVRDGKVRYWGTSTFPAWMMAEAWWIAERGGWSRPVCEQAPYNLLDRRAEGERIAFVQRYGWGLITWAPLAGGLLAGRYAHDALDRPPPGSRLAGQALQRERTTQRSLEVAGEVAAMAREMGLSSVTLAIAWLLAQPAVTAPIIGPATAAQLADYLAAQDVRLTADVLRRCDGLVPPGSAVADFHNNAGWLG